MDDRLKNAILNVDKSQNDPDGILFLSYYSFRSKLSVPFTKIQMPNWDNYKIYFGESGTSHNLIRSAIIRRYFGYNSEMNDISDIMLDELGSYGCLDEDEWNDIEQNKNLSKYKFKYKDEISFALRDYIEEIEYCGRYYIVPDLKDMSKMYCIFTFWNNVPGLGYNSKNADSSKIRNCIEEVLKRRPEIKENCQMILIANWDKPYIVYDSNDTSDISLQDNSIGYEMHNPKYGEDRATFEKRKKEILGQAYRDERDKKIADKLTTKNDLTGEFSSEMPMAQWNALRYVDESKKNMKSKRIFLTEGQYKQLQEKYTMKDKVKLVYDKNVVDGGNFPIKRNGKTYWVSRSMTVGVYVFCKDKEGIVYTLASKRGEHVHCQQNLWNAPCGYLEYGDSVPETAVKECWEETGVKIPQDKLVYIGENSENSRYSDVKYTFYCKLDGDISQYPTSMANCEPGEVTAVEWIPIDDLKKYKFVGHQASNLYNIAKKLYERETAYGTDDDYNYVMQYLQNMLSKGLIDDKQIKRVKDVLNL